MERARRLLPSGAPAVWMLSALSAATGVALAAGPLRQIGSFDAPLLVPWWSLAIAFSLVEIFVVHLQFKREAHSFSLSEIPLIVGFFFVTPIGLIAAKAIGSAVTLTLHRRQSPVKLAFNLGQFTLCTAVAVATFRVIAGLGDPLGIAGWVGAFVAVFLSDLLCGVLVTAAISLSEGGRPVDALPDLLGVGSVSALTNSVLGLIAVTILWWHPSASWLLILAAAALFVSYRGYAEVRMRGESLALLYESTMVARDAIDPAGAVTVLLQHARDMFKGRSAELVMFGSGRDAPGTSSLLDEDTDTVHVGPFPGGPRPALWDAIRDGSDIFIPRGTSDGSLRAMLWDKNTRDVMAAPLLNDGRVVGGLMVAGRLGDVLTFDRDDFRLFRTFVNHVAVSVNNARLIEQLRRQAAENRYQALHDSLTDLPNRTLFRTRVRQAIVDAVRSDHRVAVMLLDLDRFKEINDTLGHHTGDEVLREVGRRLVDTIGARGSVARLGGDEYAIVLARAGEREAEQSAEAILAAVATPIVSADMILDVGASIGIAFYPDHGESPDDLLQRSDVAMYLAKEEKAGPVTYDPERDLYTPERLSMVAELRTAIASDELSLVYQPKTSLGSGRVIGVEALVRWHRPDGTTLFPDTFIPLAETTGLIRPLTRWVLREAASRCHAWRRMGLDLSIAVNLSARELREASLPEEMRELLDVWNLPPRALVLEITESSIMAEPERAVVILERLSDMGISISIDDFGTGYSSLAYLKRLPVSELKLDRSFVQGMGSDPDDMVIVRSTVDLARNLGLTLVAEGVEDPSALETLAQMGCDVVQGYCISRPLTPEALTGWLRANRSQPIAPAGGARESHGTNRFEAVPSNIAAS